MVLSNSAQIDNMGSIVNSNTLNELEITRPELAFLVLAPIQSDSYPSPSSSPPTGSPAADAAKVFPSTTSRDSRAASISSDGAPRFLKLGPVHFGGEPGETDFATVEEMQEA